MADTPNPDSSGGTSKQSDSYQNFTFTAQSPQNKHESDVDITYDSPHHTLGKGPNQAAPGNHNHNYVDLDGTPEAPTIITDHGKLTGLADDDHKQYWTRVPATVTDWDNALSSGLYMGSGASNDPSSVRNGWWKGWAVRHNDSWVDQFAIPFAQGSIDLVLMQRAKINGAWTGWFRTTNYHYSWDVLDNFLFFKHSGSTSVPGGTPGTNRFAVGVKKGTGTGPAADEEFRIQCYDTAGTYTFNGMTMQTTGVVNFPKGHSLMAQALLSGEAVSADRAATIGIVNDMITARATEIAQAEVNKLRQELGMPVTRGLAIPPLVIGPPSVQGPEGVGDDATLPESP